MLTATEIQDILNYDYKWPIANGRVFQLTNDNNICYDGLHGELKFNENNQLEFHLEKDINNSLFILFFEQQESLRASIKSGEMYTEEKYFKLEFTDIKNRKWNSSRFIIFNGLTINPRRILINIEVSNINLININRKYSSFYSYSKDNISIFPNKFSKDLSGNSIFNKYELKLINNLVIRITKFNDIYVNSIYSESETQQRVFHIYQLVNEAINIISYHPVHYTLEDKYDYNSKSTTVQVNSYENNYSRTSSLIPSSHSCDENINIFISKYVIYFLESKPQFSNPLYLWWYRFHGYELDIENKLLILSVAIESLSLKYITINHYKPVYSNEETKTLGRLVKKSGVSKELRSRVQKYIGSLNSSSKSIVSILKQLVDSDILVENMHSDWQNIRNESAHGVERNLNFEDENSIGKIINDSNLLEEVFFRLMFHIIGYTGEFYQFSQHGYPITSLKVSERNKQT